MNCTVSRRLTTLFLALFVCGSGQARSQLAPGADSNYVKLLKKAPESRLATIIEVIGKRGDAADLTYLLSRATTDEPTGFAAATRRLAFDTLAEAASTRNLRSSAGLDDLNRWIAAGPGEDPATRLAAIRLAGVYRLPSAVDSLIAVIEGQGAETATKTQALDALATIATGPARAALARFAALTASPAIRLVAVAALARVDIDTAADRAAEVIAGSSANQDLAPLLAPFLDRQGGSDKLLGAINRHPPSGDAAKLALRAIAALGRADEALVAALSKVAGIEADPQPPDSAAMAALIAEVARQGDPVRGEGIFRRAEINCMKCHAIAGAAGGVGPELSALGLSSPVDYIVNSILIPDQAIKEEYQTRVILTDDGRVLQGIVVEEDDRRVVLRDAQGERRVVPTATIEDSKKGGSLMPKGLVGTLTRPEFIDLVRFLSELGRPGPYAIRPTPMIQRWRALQPVPASLAAAEPSPSDFRNAVLNADGSHQVALYSWTSGDLPAAELFAMTGNPLGIVQGEVIVSAAGPIRLKFGSKPRPDLTAWVDDQEVKLDPDGSATVNFVPGTRWITLRVDARKTVGPVDPIRIEVVRVENSPAEFSVVGGR